MREEDLVPEAQESLRNASVQSPLPAAGHGPERRWVFGTAVGFGFHCQNRSPFNGEEIRMVFLSCRQEEEEPLWRGREGRHARRRLSSPSR